MKKVKIVIDSNYFGLFNKYKIYNVFPNDSETSFIMKYSEYKRLPDETKALIKNCKIYDKFINFIQSNIIYLLTFIVIFVVLMIQNLSYREIKFINPDTYNEDVVKIIKDSSMEVGKFKFLNTTLVELENNLQKEYPNLEFIGIEKDASILEIEIIKSKEYLDREEENEVGDLIASKNAYVKGYKVQNGVVMIDINQMVSKGDILVSGNLLIKKNLIHYVKAKGYVFGETMEYVTVSLQKEEYDYPKTGKIEEKYKLSFFNKNFINESNFEIYETSYDVVFEIPMFMKIVKVTNYEINEVHKIYNEDQAIIEGMKKYQDDFNNGKLEDEYIINMEKITVNEYSDYYDITYLVKKYENIAVFQKVEE